MLVKLFVQNFALIDKLELDFLRGFNVLTGETGAGKSIIIDAVGTVTGSQGLTEFIRSGEKKAIVEAVFEVENNSRIMGMLEQFGFLPEQGEALILTRELVKSGKNICRINGRIVNLSLYREIAGNLIDIYGQHHQQSLLDQQKHIDLLDEYGENNLSLSDFHEIKDELAACYGQLLTLRAQLRQLEDSEKEKVRMADMYRYQLEEIDNCSPVAGEDQALDEEKNILANAERLTSLASEAYALLYESDSTRPAAELLHAALNSLRELAVVDSSLNGVYEMLESAVYQVEEAARDIKTYSAKLESDPVRLDEIESRLNRINLLKKKYGDSINEILEYRNQVAASLAVIDNYDDEVSSLRTEIESIGSKYRGLAERLTAARKQAAKDLRTCITAELRELNMPHVTFDVKIASREPLSNGQDNVEFLISPNKGEPLKPLAKIVSGGEVSRIMLAFRSILAKTGPVGTLIFDEIDAGIGGNALHATAAKLSAVGKDRQVICVTHSPQIAGIADHHFNINKVTDQTRTFTRVSKLDIQGRVEELARMLSGGKITSVSREHAEEILKQNF
ncbi:DNA repair protein RecN [Phosphitispora fastidiosa]|uniref:DNA repair protein RecN n=1 Tax=Phosphitispora fastidiosa TaxID=2837202 RepID=UPI001E37B82F|nr:DNA repair protein RecN [Phosphitispora fastidiosa]MBU7007672.1 DNA repair protein RecN (Recombination protein N) [Phosphitispora fastidiosa]